MISGHESLKSKKNKLSLGPSGPIGAPLGPRLSILPEVPLGTPLETPFEKSHEKSRERASGCERARAKFIIVIVCDAPWVVQSPSSAAHVVIHDIFVSPSARRYCTEYKDQEPAERGRRPGCDMNPCAGPRAGGLRWHPKGSNSDRCAPNVCKYTSIDPHGKQQLGPISPHG